MEADGLPEYFDAVLSIRFLTEEIINGQLDDEAKKNPTIDDILIAIDGLLYRDYKNSPGDFSLFDDKGEEY
jgi:hypothetical protein